MAESAVGLLIDKLIPLLSQEVNLLRGFRREVAHIKDELESIRAFLRDADARAQREDFNDGVKAWVKQVRETAYRIEDALDEYMLHVRQTHDLHGFRGFLITVASWVKTLKPRRKIASEIQDIKTDLGEIEKRKERYKFESCQQQEAPINIIPHDPRAVSVFIDEAELVGIEFAKDELTRQLVDPKSQRKVIAMVGMGGSGKTTLARKVYDGQNFDCQAWITVSQSYKKEDLLRGIIREFQKAKKEPLSERIGEMKEKAEGIGDMDYTSLVSHLKEYLQQKRYLVAFDDVWDSGFWGDVDRALLDNNKGSRIMITTRKQEVACSCKRSSLTYIHQMELLPPEKAWDLFCKKAFGHDYDGHCPKELEELSHDIVEKCGGLPLAIVVIGGFLADKKMVVSEWRKLRESLPSALASDSDLKNIVKILSLSYVDLPYNLKSCFLYVGMFPEDYSIRCKRLMRLWISQGYVKGMQGMTIEEVAEEYLTKLIHRSLVQVEQVDLKGKPTTCRVHDLIREAILSMSDELCFSQISETCSNFEGFARHLSISDKVHNVSNNSITSQTHSVMVFGGDELPMPLFNTICKKLKLLRTLDFEGSRIHYIPKELGNLLHLSYLSLKGTLVQKLPKSIRRLRNLETLDLRDSDVTELPVEISKFPKLQHLLGGYGHLVWQRGLKIRGNVGSLQFLQDLETIEVDDCLIKELGSLKQLRKLGIRELKREYGMSLCTELEKMTDLRSLRVVARSEEELLELQSMSSPPLLLESLLLGGKLERLPRWISQLKSLVEIRLIWSKLMDDPLKDLEALPNLMFLQLYDGYIGAQLHFGGGFQKLRQLFLVRMNGLQIVRIVEGALPLLKRLKINSPQLKIMRIDEGALPLLEQLKISDCPQLTEVPPGIQYLKNVKTLEFDDMPREIRKRMLAAPDEGQDYWIVKHIPLVYFCYITTDNRRLGAKLGDPDFDKILESA